MKAQLFIEETKKGYVVMIENGYGNNLYLTDNITLEEAQAYTLQFKESISEINIIDL